MKTVHRFPDFLYRRRTIHVVHLVEIDVIHAKTRKARLTGRADMTRRKTPIVDVLGHRLMHLRRKDDSIAPCGVRREPPAEDRLRRTDPERTTVLIGGIDEVHAGLDRRVEDIVGRSFRRSRPEVHGAETDRAHAKRAASQRPVVHGIFSQRQSLIASVDQHIVDADRNADRNVKRNAKRNATRRMSRRMDRNQHGALYFISEDAGGHRGGRIEGRRQRLAQPTPSRASGRRCCGGNHRTH